MTPPVGAFADADPLAGDADAALEQAAGALVGLRDARLLITGGTGFVGSWLLELLTRANETFGLCVRATVVTRDPDAFAGRAPRLAGSPAVELVCSDVRTFESPAGAFSHVIHAAAESNTRQAIDAPEEMRDTLVRGTGHALSVASEIGAARFLYVSSGIVYGRQPDGVARLDEDFRGELDEDDTLLDYARGKREAEALCLLHGETSGIDVTIARGFSFVGPHMPLSRVAIGQFIEAALAGRDIIVRTDGTAVRSYLYAAEMAAWLLTILIKGEPGRAYNVGSEREHTVLEAAETVARVVSGRSAVVVEGRETSGADRPRYVPSTARAREELGLRETVGLEDAVCRTVRWHTHRRS